MLDQLKLPTPGLIAQMTGFLTKQRYRYATVFVDQYSKLGYVHLQVIDTAAETIKAKKAFELFSKSKGVKIKNYHADSGIFKAKAWVEACCKKEQGLTFAAVNAHYQNGIRKKASETYRI